MYCVYCIVLYDAALKVFEWLSFFSNELQADEAAMQSIAVRVHFIFFCDSDINIGRDEGVIIAARLSSFSIFILYILKNLGTLLEIFGMMMMLSVATRFNVQPL